MIIPNIWENKKKFQTTNQRMSDDAEEFLSLSHQLGVAIQKKSSTPPASCEP